MMSCLRLTATRSPSAERSQHAGGQERERTGLRHPQKKAVARRVFESLSGQKSVGSAGQSRAFDCFNVTAARTRVFSAFSFIFSPSRKSIARRVFPSRLEL